MVEVIDLSSDASDYGENEFADVERLRKENLGTQFTLDIPSTSSSSSQRGAWSSMTKIRSTSPPQDSDLPYSSTWSHDRSVDHDDHRRDLNGGYRESSPIHLDDEDDGIVTSEDWRRQTTASSTISTAFSMGGSLNQGESSNTATSAVRDHIDHGDALTVIDENARTATSTSPPVKRKRRTKEEIAADMDAKRLEKERLKQLKANEKKLAQEKKQLEKDSNKLQRELSAAMKSKCEQYLTTFVSETLFQEYGNLRVALENSFGARDLGGQIKADGAIEDGCVVWRRRVPAGEVRDNQLVRSERLETEAIALTVISGDRFAQMIRAKTYMAFLDECQTRLAIDGCRLTIAVSGKHSVRHNEVSTVLLSGWEHNRTQLRFVSDSVQLAALILQMHRAIAAIDKKMEQRDRVMLVHVEKGIREGDGEELIKDWWTKMLAHLPRMPEEQQRALIRRHPNPFRLADQLRDAVDRNIAIRDLANVEGDNGRRIGPVIANRIYLMLTSETGEESLE